MESTEIDESIRKCVMVIDSSLPLGLMVNTAAVLAVTLGRRIESIVGSDVVDGSGGLHAGITNTTLPILAANADKIRQIREKAGSLTEILLVDFTEPAQKSLTYEIYRQRIRMISSEQLNYLGVALYGPRNAISKLTGNLPLLREETARFVRAPST
jgi:hypothetical protein